MRLDRFDWLALVDEEPVDPDQEIVDPHHHLWSRGSSPYLAEQLHDDSRAGHNVVQTVFVECLSHYRKDGPEELRTVGETEFVAEQADEAAALGGPTIAAIVSFADLALGRAVEDVLHAHDEAGKGRFRGIRHATSWDADIGPGHTGAPAELMMTPEFREGFVTLGAMGFSYDAWLFHPQLPELVDLARTHPDVPIILDHIGAPMGCPPYADRRDEVLAAWRPAMSEVATCPNVVLKVGGIGMQRYYGPGWSEQDTPPSSDELLAYWGDELRFCIDEFGPDRCMFESNFPVDRESCSYTTLWNVYQKLGAEYSAAERDELFAGTARRAYRIE